MTLKERLGQARILLAPGVTDALTALIAARAGAEALYLTGAGIAYTRLGRPDIGLVTATEVAQTIALIRERVDTPLIVDADTGFGNALNIQRTVRIFEQAGADALQIEDQTFPKRCGHLAGKSLIPAAEMAGKIRAAVDARRNALIIARTDAIAVEGFEAALARAEAYLEAGADILFIEAPRNTAELCAIADRFARRVPLLANMVEGGRTPLQDAPALQALGFRIAIFPGGIVRALVRTAQDYYASLIAHGSTLPFRDRMLDFAALNDLLGTKELLDLGKRYE
ncbi:MAG: isocitrate lyase family enzyme [Paracoccaceae bacterium]|nr:MAG: isocitrate lyase family enzyme [Paracoccaceae bacterium]